MDWSNTSVAAAAGGLCAGDGVDSSSSDSELQNYSNDNNNTALQNSTKSSTDDCGKKRTIDDVSVLYHTVGISIQ